MPTLSLTHVGMHVRSSAIPKGQPKAVAKAAAAAMRTKAIRTCQILRRYAEAGLRICQLSSVSRQNVCQA